MPKKSLVNDLENTSRKNLVVNTNLKAPSSLDRQQQHQQLQQSFITPQTQSSDRRKSMSSFNTLDRPMHWGRFFPTICRLYIISTNSIFPQLTDYFIHLWHSICVKFAN